MAFCYGVLQSTVMYGRLLWCVAVHCDILQSVMVCCSPQWYTAGCYGVLQSTLIYFSLLWCVEVHCDILQSFMVCFSPQWYISVCYGVLQSTVIYCSLLWCVAVHSDILQSVMVYCSLLHFHPFVSLMIVFGWHYTRWFKYDRNSDLCVNKPHLSRSYLNHLVFVIS
jgi:hypothetical protein